MIENQNLIWDDFRNTYGRPFYTWDNIEDASKKALFVQYTRYLSRLQDDIDLPKDVRLYRIKILQELLKDLENA